MSETALKDFIARYKAMIADLEKSVKGFEKELAEVTDNNSVVVTKSFIDANLEARDLREYKNKAIFLSRVYYNWELKEDSGNMLCLIPTKKGVTK